MPAETGLRHLAPKPFPEKDMKQPFGAVVVMKLKMRLWLMLGLGAIIGFLDPTAQQVGAVAWRNRRHR